jgi:uracil-DNA glycosylase family 4
MANSIYTDLAAYLKNNQQKGGIVLYRDNREREILHDWLLRDNSDGDARDRQRTLKETIEECARCGDVKERKFGIGTGENQVMVVLNSPKLVNTVEKQLLKEESISLLKKIISAANLDSNQCYITNLQKCELNDPLIQPSQAIKNCEAIFKREMDAVQPRIVIVFGEILPLQKIIKESTGVFWYNIDHPITLIKNPDLKRAAWNTVKTVMKKLSDLEIISL